MPQHRTHQQALTGHHPSPTARVGAGIVAARTPKKVLQMAGIEDCYTCSRGSTRTLVRTAVFGGHCARAPPPLPLLRR